MTLKTVHTGMLKMLHITLKRGKWFLDTLFSLIKYIQLNVIWKTWLFESISVSFFPTFMLNQNWPPKHFILYYYCIIIVIILILHLTFKFEPHAHLFMPCSHLQTNSRLQLITAWLKVFVNQSLRDKKLIRPSLSTRTRTNGIEFAW